MREIISQVQPIIWYLFAVTVIVWVLNQTRSEHWLRLQIEAINLISPTLLGFSSILIGAFMSIRSPANSSTGNQLITGGFALITGAKLQESRDHNAKTRSSDPPPSIPAPEAPKEGGV